MPKYDKADIERRMNGAVEALKHDLGGLRTGRGRGEGTQGDRTGGDESESRGGGESGHGYSSVRDARGISSRHRR